MDIIRIFYRAVLYLRISCGTVSANMNIITVIISFGNVDDKCLSQL